MKKILLISGMVLGSVAGIAQLKPIAKDSKVEFKIKNFGFTVDGHFEEIEGTIGFDPAKPEAASFNVNVKSESINTGNETRDGHLGRFEYFDTKNFPLISFVSEKVQKGRGDGYSVTGKLTIKKHTKEISFPFTATAKGSGYLFTGSFKINRREFDIGGSSTVADNLEVNLSVAAE